MSKTYDVSIRLPVSKLATVIEILDGEGELLSVKATENAPIKHRRKPALRVLVAPKGGANGVRGVDLVLAHAKELGTFTSLSIAAAFKANGFKPVSASPRINEAVMAGWVKHVDRGKWEITEKGRKA